MQPSEHGRRIPASDNPRIDRKVSALKFFDGLEKVDPISVYLQLPQGELCAI
jgi:hypothetical protein